MVDITVRGADGVPDQAHLSLRVGDVRRQMQFKLGGHFRFDSVPPRSFVLDVFQKVGSAQVSLDDLKPAGGDDGQPPHREGSVDVLLASGSAMKVDLHVAALSGSLPTSPCGRGVVESAPPQRPAPTALARQQQQQQEQQQVHPDAKKALRHTAAVKAKSYLDGHAVQKLLQGMVHDLLEAQPSNPLSFMLGYLRDTQARTQAAAVAEQEAECLAASDDEPPGFAADGTDPLPEDLSGHCSAAMAALREDPDMYRRLSSCKTCKGVTFAKCIKAGVDNPGHALVRAPGITAGDAACYEVFREAFDPVVAAWHDGYGRDAAHFTDMNPARILDSPLAPEGAGRVLSVYAGAARNLEGMRFTNACSFEERRRVEEVLASAVEGSLRVEGLAGRYCPLRGSKSFAAHPSGMSFDDEASLRGRGFMFEEPDSPMLVSAGFRRHWPHARGIFCIDNGGLAVRVNENDHLKIMVQRKDGDLKQAFSLLARVDGALAAALSSSGHGYARSRHLGFLTTCPSRLGTGMTIGAVICMPRLSADAAKLRDFCKRLGLAARCQVQQPAAGSPQDTWEVSCPGRLGTSEVEQANMLVRGCLELLRAEAADSSSSGSGPPREAADEGEEEEGSWGEDEDEGFPVDECPEELPDLSEHHSMVAQVLRESPEIYDQLRSRVTPLGVSLARCIKTGMDNVGHAFIRTIGVVAGDAHCYDVFRELFDPVISERHAHVDAESVQHVTDVDVRKIFGARMDPSGSHVLEVRAKMSRNIEGLRFPPACSLEERREAERLITRGLIMLSGGMQGEYLPASGSESFAPRPGGAMPEEEARLRAGGFQMEEPDADVLISSGFARDWPDARGIFVSRDKQLSARVNEEDHLLIECSQRGSDLAAVFERACQALAGVEAQLRRSGREWARSDRLGFLGACPSKLGTCLTLVVAVQLPELASRRADFKSLCNRLGIHAKVSTTAGQQKLGQKGVLEVSNVDRLGSSEVDQVNLVLGSCQVLVAIEQRLAKKLPVDFASEPQASLALSAGSSRGSAAEGAAASLVATPRAGEGAAGGGGAGAFADVAGLGDDETPGFPCDECPEVMPCLAKHHSLMADTLRADPSIYAKLRCGRTNKGVTFAKCVKAGFDNCGHPMIKTVGVVAGDAECYDTFSAIFDPILQVTLGPFDKVCHEKVVDPSQIQEADFGEAGRYITSVRIRARRNLAGLRFPAAMSRDERVEVERLLTRALGEFAGDLEGEYLPLMGSNSFASRPAGMTQEEEALLEESGLLFYAPDAAPALSSGLGRDWPHARGVFWTYSGEFAAWLNEEDHLCLWATQTGPDVNAALVRLVRAEAALQEALRQDGQSFAWSSASGHLTTCPSKSGNAVRVEMSVNLQLLSKRMDFRQLCRALQLQAKSYGIGQQGVWEISSTARLPSVADQVNGLVAGVSELVGWEAKLSRGEQVDFGTAS